ncbi:SOS response-associated peptidase [Aestuariibaculum sp. YM273]|uniref:SOS response-associated peptidase n=1 Tax=Aestuariibaculum sp. YM273 TaxID=3070659 RepID=UPI0027DC2CF7|nr:SOS response-associated peptidase [Aestuariibaculum sp. YM273]WMI65375.1 SOS response-associated peptidase [Aestuariibaculum sp. YM273]
MCFHTALTKPIKEIKKRFDVGTDSAMDVYQPYYHHNGFSDEYIYIIKGEEPYTMVPSYWGIMPEDYNIYSRTGFLKKTNTLNARSENLFTSPLFSKHIRTQRCMILCDGFYEPHHRNNVSYPHLIQMKDKQLFVFAGIYSELDDGLYTASIITTLANDQMKEIHNKPSKQGDFRMPLILDEKNEFDWLDLNLNDNQIKELLFTFTSQDLISHPVSRDLFNARVNTNAPEIMQPVYYDALNTLF